MPNRRQELATYTQHPKSYAGQTPAAGPWVKAENGIEADGWRRPLLSGLQSPHLYNKEVGLGVLHLHLPSGCLSVAKTANLGKRDRGRVGKGEFLALQYLREHPQLQRTE